MRPYQVMQLEYGTPFVLIKDIETFKTRFVRVPIYVKTSVEVDKKYVVRRLCEDGVVGGKDNYTLLPHEEEIMPLQLGRKQVCVASDLRRPSRECLELLEDPGYE